MYRVVISMHNRLMRNEKPITYAVIETDLGHRVYAKKRLAGVFEQVRAYADGSYLADGSVTAGSGAGLLGNESRVKSFGGLERQIRPKKEGLLVGYTVKPQQHVTLSLNNQDCYFSRLLPKEPFLSKPMQWFTGFESESIYTHKEVFSGIISEVALTNGGNVLALEADER